MRLFRSVAVILLFGLGLGTGGVLAQQLTTATGTGASRDAALTDARRNAIEQAIGVVVSSRTISENYQLVQDNIISRANGFVTSYKVIREGTGASGLYEVTIEASVTEVAEAVLNDGRALDALIEAVGRPRMMFLINEELPGNWWDRSTGIVEPVLMELFFDKGFALVDRDQLRAIRTNDQGRQAALGNVDAVQSLGRMYSAECAVVGKATATEGAGAYGFANVRADLALKVIRVDTGELLGVVHEQARAANPAAGTAARSAFEECSQVAARAIFKHIVKKWGQESANAASVQVQITNIDFLGASDFEEWLKTRVAGVRYIHSRPFESNVAELEVQYEGTANELAKAIAKAYPMQVSSVTQNKLVLQPKK